MLFLPGSCGGPDGRLGDHKAIGNEGSFCGSWRGDRGGWGGMTTSCILFPWSQNSSTSDIHRAPTDSFPRVSTEVFVKGPLLAPSLSFLTVPDTAFVIAMETCLPFLNVSALLVQVPFLDGSAAPPTPGGVSCPAVGPAGRVLLLQSPTAPGPGLCPNAHQPVLKC